MLHPTASLQAELVMLRGKGRLRCSHRHHFVALPPAHLTHDFDVGDFETGPGGAACPS